MKKLKTTFNKAHTIFCELVLKQCCAMEKSVVDYKIAIEDIRMKSYEIRRFNF